MEIANFEPADFDDYPLTPVCYLCGSGDGEESLITLVGGLYICRSCRDDSEKHRPKYIDQDGVTRDANGNINAIKDM